MFSPAKSARKDREQDGSSFILAPGRAGVLADAAVRKRPTALQEAPKPYFRWLLWRNLPLSPSPENTASASSVVSSVPSFYILRECSSRLNNKRRLRRRPRARRLRCFLYSPFRAFRGSFHGGLNCLTHACRYFRVGKWLVHMGGHGVAAVSFVKQAQFGIGAVLCTIAGLQVVSRPFSTRPYHGCVCSTPPPPVLDNIARDPAPF